MSSKEQDDNSTPGPFASSGAGVGGQQAGQASMTHRQRRASMKRRASLIEIMAAEQLHHIEEKMQVATPTSRRATARSNASGDMRSAAAAATAATHSSVTERVEIIQAILERGEADTAKEEVEIMRGEKQQLETQLRDVERTIAQLSADLGLGGGGGGGETKGGDQDASGTGQASSDPLAAAAANEGNEQFKQLKEACAALEAELGGLHGEEAVLKGEIAKIIAISSNEVKLTEGDLDQLRRKIRQAEAESARLEVECQREARELKKADGVLDSLRLANDQAAAAVKSLEEELQQKLTVKPSERVKEANRHMRRLREGNSKLQDRIRSLQDEIRHAGKPKHLRDNKKAAAARGGGGKKGGKKDPPKLTPAEAAEAAANVEELQKKAKSLNKKLGWWRRRWEKARLARKLGERGMEDGDGTGAGGLGDGTGEGGGDGGRGGGGGGGMQLTPGGSTRRMVSKQTFGSTMGSGMFGSSNAFVYKYDTDALDGGNDGIGAEASHRVMEYAGDSSRLIVDTGDGMTAAAAAAVAGGFGLPGQRPVGDGTDSSQPADLAARFRAQFRQGGTGGSNSSIGSGASGATAVSIQLFGSPDVTGAGGSSPAAAAGGGGSAGAKRFLGAARGGE